MALQAVQVGARTIDGKVSILPDAIQEDSCIPADSRTARLIRTVANTITPMILMGEDYPTNHPSGRLPILDCEV